jgi:hypothetical protein
VEKNLDSHGKVVSTKRETWETLMLDGQPYRRTLERNGKALSPEEQRSEQKKLDRETRRLSSEAPAEKVRRLEEAERRRRREFAFLSEIPELFDLRFEGDSTVDGRSVWVVSGAPRAMISTTNTTMAMTLWMTGSRRASCDSHWQVCN